MTRDHAETMLDAAEQAAIAALTLADGLEAEELLRSRLTRREVQRLLLIVASTLSGFEKPARETLPELDWEAWSSAAARLTSASEDPDDALWSTVHTLAPVTVSWLRLYRSQR